MNESEMTITVSPIVSRHCTSNLDSESIRFHISLKRKIRMNRRDELVVDARPQQRGGMLIMQLVLMDAGGYWGKMGSRQRPRWLRSILATNRHHARTQCIIADEIPNGNKSC